jgi:hypothetical protein
VRRVGFSIAVLLVLVTIAACTVTEPRLIRVEANPDEGFSWPYYLYIPGSLRKENLHLLVMPTNTGIVSDDHTVHDQWARDWISGTSWLARDLRIPYLVPAFPRPATPEREVRARNDTWVVNVIDPHYLNRESLPTDIAGLKRVDLQLVAMIDDAIEKLAAQGLKVERDVLHGGFLFAG